MNTCGTISNTCNIFNELVKEDMKKHYIEYSKKMIPQKIEKLTECKMFAYYKNPNNTKTYKTVEEYDKEIEELSKQINKDNYDDILESMKKSYVSYMFESKISRGREYASYSFIENEYAMFIKNVLNYDISEYDDTKEYDDDEDM